MVETKVRFAWHIHHHLLVEPVIEGGTAYGGDGLRGRIHFIRREKPTNERELRLRLLKLVEGKLPSAYVRAAEAYAAEVTRSPRRFRLLDDAAMEMTKAQSNGAAAINKLHALECTDCPWDAKRQTIFPRGHRGEWGT